jgi:hypothetical protein
MKRWSREYYIKNFKEMATWKKIMLVVMVLLCLFGVGGLTFWKQDDALDWSEKPPVYGVQKKIEF